MTWFEDRKFSVAASQKIMTKQTRVADKVQCQARYFEQHIQAVAPNYFKNLESGNFSIKHDSSDIRPASYFHRFILGTNGSKHQVLVKVPLLRRKTYGRLEVLGRERKIERPRIVPITKQEIKPELEFRALSQIFDYFNGMEDPRFGAVRVLEYIQDQDAIIMEEVSLPSLKQLFINASRLSFSPSLGSLDDSFRNSGAWLRMFHQMEREEDLPVRHSKRSEFINSMDELTNYLGFHLKDQKSFGDIARTLKSSALSHLPESLPIGLGHGDFAMRNILVGSSGQVTVLDTLARWQAPIFEDIGYFLVGLKTAGLLVFTCGLAFSKDLLERYKRQFLIGYFYNERVPYSIVRLFEAQALLDKWSARLTALKFGRQEGVSIANHIKSGFLNKHFRDLLNRIVSEVS